MKFQQAYRAAFTLIELLVVIAIIGIMAAIVAPTLSGFRKGDAMASATSQLLGGVSRARQLAISQRADVYMVFLPTNYWGTIDWNQLTYSQKVAATNLADKQLTGYTFVSFRQVGDQPGRGTTNYLSSWQALPSGIFIPSEKFVDNVNYSYPIFDPAKGETFNIHSFARREFPFPTADSKVSLLLPYIAFDYRGKLISPLPTGENNEFIPLAHGSVLTPRNPQTKVLQIGPADPLEQPPGNSTNGYHLVSIDWLTGRGHLERREIQ